MTAMSFAPQATLTWKQLSVAPNSIDIPGRRITNMQKKKHEPHWSFVTGRRLVFQRKVVSTGFNDHPKGFRSPSASGLVGPQIAISMGTIAVIPFYALMILGPNAPILEGLAKMFSDEMTLASAWIHLLVVDLFAARQIYFDGLENKVETRHSLLLCLFSCPIGVIAHVITKLLFKTSLFQKSDEDD